MNEPETMRTILKNAKTGVPVAPAGDDLDV
jgi:hypothetical protein